VSNLLEILAASAGGDPRDLATGYANYGSLKADVAAALIEKLRPVQERYRELAGDPDTTAGILAKGADKAEAIASVTLERAQRAVGLLPR
jgi:tryptophanyl-tRNA synthetase